MVFFFSAASCKKDIIFGAAGTNFVPSYFVTALVNKSFISSQSPH
jgi:hypothetical protein